MEIINEAENKVKTVIKVSELTKKYYSTTALSGVTLELPERGIVGLIGRNGSGKTTLMRELIGQLEPTSGKITIFDDNPINNLNVLGRMVYLYHNYEYTSGSRLSDILRQYEIMFESFDKEFAIKLVDFFDLKLKLKYKELSQGMASVFNFICGLACRCDITLFDEPVLGMDVTVRKTVYEVLLRDYIEHPRLFIISSHLLSELEGVMTDVVLLDAGSVVIKSEIATLQQTVFRVSGDKAEIEAYIADKNVIYKRFGKINNFAVINEEYSDENAQELKSHNLTASSVKVEDLFVYLTGDNKEEAMECLWK